MEILATLAEIEDGVTDELARAVVGRLTASIDNVDWMGQCGCFPQAGLIRRAADGVHGLVFQEEDVVGLGRVGLFSSDGFILQGEAIGIGDTSEPFGTESRGRQQDA